jgi:hypothetical protein
MTRPLRIEQAGNRLRHMMRLVAQPSPRDPQDAKSRELK